MYTAVRIVKMNACRTHTSTSKAVRAISRPSEKGQMTMSRERLQSDAVMMAKLVEQQVAGEHVGEESNGLRERAHDQDLHELDRRDEEVEGPGHARREHRVLEVADGTLLRDAHDEVDDPHEQGHEHRQCDACVHRHLRARDDPPDVEGEDEREQREEERRELHAVGADRLEDDAVVHEVDRRLGDVLHALRDERLLAAARVHDPEHQRDRHPHEDDDLVDAERSRRPLDDVADRRELDREDVDHWANVSLLPGTGSGTGNGKRGGDVVALPSQEAELRDEQRDRERGQIHPRLVLHEHDDERARAACAARNPPSAATMSMFAEVRAPQV